MTDESLHVLFRLKTEKEKEKKSFTNSSIDGARHLHLVNFGSESSGVSGNDKSSKLMIKSETSSAWIGAIISEHKNFAPIK